MLLRAIASTLVLLLGTVSARAQYPAKPITIVVAFAPGGGTDTAARLLSKELAQELGQTVIVDNRAGAGGAIGAATVARAAPDGYTLLLGTGSELAVLPAVKAKPPYDTLRDFAPIARIGSVSFMLVANPSIAANSVQELIAAARQSPGNIAFASFGMGSTNHLMGEAFAAATGIQLLHVPYRGSGAAVTDLLAGQVQIAFDTISVVLPYVKSGKLKGLAVPSRARSALAPSIPTVEESGVAGFSYEGWLGLLGPRHVPTDIIARLRQALGRVLQMRHVADALHERGLQLDGADAKPFVTVIKDDLDRWKEIARASSIQVE